MNVDGLPGDISGSEGESEDDGGGLLLLLLLLLFVEVDVEVEVFVVDDVFWLDVDGVERIGGVFINIRGGGGEVCEGP